MASFTRFKCWEDNRISKVINKEAVSIDRREFLVTHTPFEEIQVLKSPEYNKSTNEEKFLKEILKRAKNNEHTFSVIQGMPGTGKSHIIRWLKERYSLINQNDEVILIERSNSTLQGVLRQIIESKAFNAQEMQDQYSQLQTAFGRLSEKTLGDIFLNNLSVGVNDGLNLYPGTIISPQTRKKIYAWLLDMNVRDWFKRKYGPVERVKRHLAQAEDEKGLNENDYPGILPDDLLLDTETVSNIEAGYQIVRDFTSQLCEKPELRKEIAAYLDSLVGFAIETSVSLSSEDLKSIFFKLRSNLLKKGKGLALFIEDITAFTGIDNGLVDVLATQHTGVGNTAYCRVLSVIGITDSYYKDKFPDNLKDRIVIHLTLNSIEDSTTRSSLLTRPEVLTGMVARYLNAIRTSEKELNKWLSNGENLSEIPIRCDNCDFNKECFSAFGEVEVQMSQNGVKYKIGLYPFNDQAIQTMFSNLDTKVAKTPRSLLTSVVEYVLHNHGNKIREKEFPPAPQELGGEFKPPELTEPLQRTALEVQAGENAKRMLSLILFWGNKTIYAEDTQNGKTLGGLKESLFQAFSLPMIKGQLRGEKVSDIKKPNKLATRTDAPGYYDGSGNPTGTVEPIILFYNDKYKRYEEDITNWRDNGPLEYYNIYAEWVSNFWKNSIQWAEFDISQFQSYTRLSGGRIYFEGQRGEKGKSPLRFKRSGFLADVLQALAQLECLDVPLNKLGDSKVGAITGILSKWKAEHEVEVANFVKSISEQTPAPLSIYQVSVVNNLIINILGGDFSKPNPDPMLMFDNIISVACAKPKWLDNWKDEFHPQVWSEICRQFTVDEIESSRGNFLSLLNLPQGISKPTVSYSRGGGSVYILDAEKAISAIKVFLENGNPNQIRQKNDPDDSIWKNELKIYLKVQDKFLPILKAQVADFKQITADIKKKLGANTPQEVFKALRKVEISYNAAYRLYIGNSRTELTGDLLELLLAQIDEIIKENSPSSLALRISSSFREIKTLIEYQKYLEVEYSILKKNMAEIGEESKVSQGGVDIDLENKVLEHYKKTQDNLEKTKKLL